MKQTYTITITKEVPSPNKEMAQMIANSMANQIGGEVYKIDDNNELPF
ncbi:hypothetical protein [Aquimarina macrocephali]